MADRNGPPRAERGGLCFANSKTTYGRISAQRFSLLTPRFKMPLGECSAKLDQDSARIIIAMINVNALTKITEISPVSKSASATPLNGFGLTIAAH
jgi:hypothetical protein